MQYRKQFNAFLETPLGKSVVVCHFPFHLVFGQFASAACISKESLNIVHFVVSSPDVLHLVLLPPDFVAQLVH